MFWVILGVIFVLMLLNSTVGQALAGRIEAGPREADELVAKRIAALEGEVERLATDVRRLEEESEFLEKLLAERPPQGKSLPPSDSAQ
jgi:hypothetical protein